MKSLSIKLKVLLVLLVLVSIMISGMSVVIHSSFNKSFIQYRENIEKEFQNLLSEKLIRNFEEERSWSGLKSNRRLWNELVHSSAIETGEPEALRHPKPPPHLHELKKPPKKDKAIHKKMAYRQPLIPPAAVFDAQKNFVVGTRADFQYEKKYIRLESNGELIGYLAVQSYKKLNHDIDKRFVAGVNHMLIKLGLLMFALAVILAFPIANYLTRRIEKINNATYQIAAGDFDLTLDSKGKDELSQLASNVNYMAKSLQATSEAQRSMMADIAHELRTPVAVILAKVEAIQDGVHDASQETMNLLHAQILSLKNIINDLYQLSESDLGSLKYRMKEVSLSQLLSQSYQSFEHRFKDKNIDFKLLLKNRNVNIQGDLNRLNQLMNNLLQNSLEYTASNGSVEMVLDQNEERIRITIDDSEPGLSKQQREKIFQRWYRVDESRNRNSGGSGLGLAICKQIAKAHDFEIYAESSHLGGLRIVMEWQNR